LRGRFRVSRRAIAPATVPVCIVFFFALHLGHEGREALVKSYDQSVPLTHLFEEEIAPRS